MKPIMLPDNIADELIDLMNSQANASLTLHLDAGVVRKAETAKTLKAIADKV